MAEVGRHRVGAAQGGASGGTRIALNSEISLGAGPQPRYGKPGPVQSYSAQAWQEASHEGAMEVVVVVGADAGARYIDSDEDDVPGLVSVSHNSSQIVGSRQAPVAAEPRGAITSQHPRAQDSASPAKSSPAGARYIDSDEDDVPGLVSVSHNSSQIVGSRPASVAAKPRGAIRAFTSQHPRAQDSASPAASFMAATQNADPEQQLARDDAVALLWQHGFPPRKIHEILSQCEQEAEDRERRVAAYWAKGALRKSLSEHHFSLAHSRGPDTSHNTARHFEVHHRDARPRARSGYNLPSLAMEASPHVHRARQKSPSSPAWSPHRPMSGNAASSLHAPPAGPGQGPESKMEKERKALQDKALRQAVFRMAQQGPQSPSSPETASPSTRRRGERENSEHLGWASPPKPGPSPSLQPASAQRAVRSATAYTPPRTSNRARTGGRSRSEASQAVTSSSSQAVTNVSISPLMGYRENPTQMGGSAYPTDTAGRSRSERGGAGGGGGRVRRKSSPAPPPRNLCALLPV